MFVQKSQYIQHIAGCRFLSLLVLLKVTGLLEDTVNIKAWLAATLLCRRTIISYGLNWLHYWNFTVNFLSSAFMTIMIPCGGLLDLIVFDFSRTITINHTEVTTVICFSRNVGLSATWKDFLQLKMTAF